MKTDRELMQQALHTLKLIDEAMPFPVAKLTIKNLSERLAHPEHPVAHAVIAGALFDFMGWLTSRKERIVLSSADNASPAVEVITEFAKMRGLSLDDAKVQDWQDMARSRDAS